MVFPFAASQSMIDSHQSNMVFSCFCQTVLRFDSDKPKEDVSTRMGSRGFVSGSGKWRKCSGRPQIVLTRWPYLHVLLRTGRRYLHVLL
jgi:hypothetical protein